MSPDEQFRLKKEDIYEEGIQPAHLQSKANSGASDAQANDSFDEINQFSMEVKNTRSDTMFQRKAGDKKSELKDFKV